LKEVFEVKFIHKINHDPKTQELFVDQYLNINYRRKDEKREFFFKVEYKAKGIAKYKKG